MKNAKKQITLALFGTMFAGCLTWSAVSFTARNPAAAADKRSFSQEASPKQLQGPADEAGELSPSQVAYACETTDETDTASWKERFKIYEPFGITYDAEKDELRYHGKLVRCFEDYYPLDATGNLAAGTDFFQENGVTDIYAVRDLTNITVNRDGSYDPSGTLTGLREASKEEYASRDIDAFKNPPTAEAVCEGELTAEEIAELAAEYKPFGVTYDPAADKWYFHGEPVRRFEDILLSNGEAPGGGNFSGSLRSTYDEDGTVDIYTERDFTRLNKDGNGTLVNVKKQGK